MSSAGGEIWPKRFEKGKKALDLCSFSGYNTICSVKGELKVEICSKCHPFYTGRQKLVDTGGRVDRFKKRYGIN